MSDRPISLKVEEIEGALIESVEIALEERSVANNASAPVDPALAYYVAEPAISGFVECEPNL